MQEVVIASYQFVKVRNNNVKNNTVEKTQYEKVIKSEYELFPLKEQTFMQRHRMKNGEIENVTDFFFNNELMFLHEVLVVHN